MIDNQAGHPKAEDVARPGHAPDDVLGVIELPAPDLLGSATLMTALARRASAREFSPGVLPDWMIGEMLWAASGINRMFASGQTAPVKRDLYHIDIYAVLPSGVYRYEALAHCLILRRALDARALTGSQDFVAGAPLNLVYVVVDKNGSRERSAETATSSLITVGCIAQNVSLYCAATGLASVIRGEFVAGPLAGALGLVDGEAPVLAQSIGQPLGFRHEAGRS